VYTVDAYVEAYSVERNATRSWIGIQRAVSAAFLLGMTQESHYDQQIHSLLRNLELVISERTRIDSTIFDTNDMRSPVMGQAPNIAYGDNTPTSAPHQNDYTKDSVSKAPHWARTMARTLKALSKLNGALAAPRTTTEMQLPPVFQPSAINNGSVAGNDQLWSGQFSPINSALVMPATPESSSSGDWNYANLGERAAEYVQPGIWG
jgi:hypothetical protein